MTGLEWRYLPGGQVKHALHRASDPTAVCGVGPQWWTGAGWYGTGSQTEYETVAALRECRRCTDILPGGRP